MKKLLILFLMSWIAPAAMVWGQNETAKETSEVPPLPLADDQPELMDMPPGQPGMPQRQPGHWMRPGMDREGSGPMHNPRQRRGMQNAPMNPEDFQEKLEELMVFLKEYEPSLLQVIEEYRQSNAEAFENHLPTLMRTYVPIMEQMKTDPEMGKISLNKVRLKGLVQQAVKTYQGAEAGRKDAAMSELRARLSDVFSLSIEQQQLTVKRWRERLEKSAQWREILADKMAADGSALEPDKPADDKAAAVEQADKPQPPMEKRDRPRRAKAPDGEKDLRPGMEPRAGQLDQPGMPPRGERGKFAKHRAKAMRENLENQITKTEKAITFWQENKEKLIDQRIEQLLSDTMPFPW